METKPETLFPFANINSSPVYAYLIRAAILADGEPSQKVWEGELAHIVAVDDTQARNLACAYIEETVIEYDVRIHPFIEILRLEKDRALATSPKALAQMLSQAAQTNAEWMGDRELAINAMARMLQVAFEVMSGEQAAVVTSLLHQRNIMHSSCYVLVDSSNSECKPHEL